MSELPRKTKAAILVELRQPLVLAEIDLPPSLAAGQVLVKVHYSGICGSQLGEIDGVKGEDKFLPHLLGHEGSGTVIAIGPGVKKVKPGDKVVLHWRKGTGIESDPSTYNWNGIKVNAGWITTFSEYSVISENRITVIPQDSDLQTASLLGCAVLTGFGVVQNDAKLKIGESVVVFGAGGVGLNIIQAASLISAYPIVAVDLFDNRLEMARLFGATHLINSSESNARPEILNIIKDQGLDVFIDNTGIPEIIEMGYEITKTNGRIILVGVPRAGHNIISIYSLPLHFGKELKGSHGGESIPQIDIPRYLNLYRIRRIKLKELISALYPLENINSAISQMRTGKIAGRCLIQNCFT